MGAAVGRRGEGRGMGRCVSRARAPSVPQGQELRALLVPRLFARVAGLRKKDGPLLSVPVIGL